jgi:hypothetical protein
VDTLSTAAVVQAGAAVVTVGAALIAAWITWRAPHRAAELAERLRVQNEAAKTVLDEKLRIFRVLMDHRGRNISAPAPVDALNMIVVAFADDNEVREAFARFLEVINGAENASARVERYIDILAVMARSLGFESVRRSEINRGYFPLTTSS